LLTVSAYCRPSNTRCLLCCQLLPSVSGAAALVPGSFYLEKKGVYVAICACTADGSLHRLILPSSRSREGATSPAFHTWHKVVFKGDTRVSFASWANACNVAVAGTSGRVVIVKFPEEYRVNGASGCLQAECGDTVAWSGLLPFGSRSTSVDAIIGLASCDAGGGGHAVSLHVSGKVRFWSYLDSACVATTTLTLPEAVGSELRGATVFTLQPQPEAGEGAQIVLGCVRGASGDALVAIPAQFGPRSVLVQSHSCVPVDAVRRALPRHLKTELGFGTSVMLSGGCVWLAWRHEDSAGVITCHNSTRVAPTFAPTNVVLPLDCGRSTIDVAPSDTSSADAVSAHFLAQLFDSQRFNLGNVVHVLDELGCVLPVEEAQSEDALKGRLIGVVSDAARRDVAGDDYIHACITAWSDVLYRCEADWKRDATLLDVCVGVPAALVLRWSGLSAVLPATPHQVWGFVFVKFQVSFPLQRATYEICRGSRSFTLPVYFVWIPVKA
jgi:hypothetical protein